jgi:hypothetical protein
MSHLMSLFALHMSALPIADIPLPNLSLDALSLGEGMSIRAN